MEIKLPVERQQAWEDTCSFLQVPSLACCLANGSYIARTSSFPRHAWPA
ncbi:MAG: hypothetical protein LBF09_05735 [Odoribacteraceae bacterium]|nr:hypothetical protein [Odoribacteraceae bacterium]